MSYAYTVFYREIWRHIGFRGSRVEVPIPDMGPVEAL